MAQLLYKEPHYSIVLKLQLRFQKSQEVKLFKPYKIVSSFPDVCNHPELMFPSHTMKVTWGSLELTEDLIAVIPRSLSGPSWLRGQIQQPLTEQGVVSLQIYDYVSLLFNNFF